MEDGGSDRRHGRPDRRGPGEKTKILIVDAHPLFRVGRTNEARSEGAKVELNLPVPHAGLWCRAVPWMP
jgi:hypothetical protein